MVKYWIILLCYTSQFSFNQCAPWNPPADSEDWEFNKDVLQDVVLFQFSERSTPQLPNSYYPHKNNKWDFVKLAENSDNKLQYIPTQDNTVQDLLLESLGEPIANDFLNKLIKLDDGLFMSDSSNFRSYENEDSNGLERPPKLSSILEVYTDLSKPKNEKKQISNYQYEKPMAKYKKEEFYNDLDTIMSELQNPEEKEATTMNYLSNLFIFSPELTEPTKHYFSMEEVEYTPDRIPSLNFNILPLQDMVDQQTDSAEMDTSSDKCCENEDILSDNQNLNKYDQLLGNSDKSELATTWSNTDVDKIKTTKYYSSYYPKLGSLTLQNYPNLHGQSYKDVPEVAPDVINMEDNYDYDNDFKVIKLTNELPDLKNSDQSNELVYGLQLQNDKFIVNHNSEESEFLRDAPIESHIEKTHMGDLDLSRTSSDRKVLIDSFLTELDKDINKGQQNKQDVSSSYSNPIRSTDKVEEEKSIWKKLQEKVVVAYKQAKDSAKEIITQ